MTDEDEATQEALHLERAKTQTLDRLAAVRLLLSTDRRAAEYDIILATVYECLRSGAKTEAELFQFAEETWPGAILTPQSFHAALQAAREMGFLENSRGLGDSLLWSLSDRSVGDIDSSTIWADQALNRCEEFLRDEATKAFGPATRPGDIHRWLEVLVIALFDAIKTAFVGDGDIRLFDGAMVVRKYDVDVMLASIRALVDDAEVSTFLEGLAVAALDPSQPFGSELVHFIATGYALHAFLAHRDHHAAREVVGTLEGQEVMLDTPSVLPLLGPDAVSSPIRQAIEVALKFKMRVVVQTETLRELEALVDRTARTELPAVRADLEAGTDPELLAALMPGTPIALWLLAREAGELNVWTHFEDRVSNLSNHLANLGVTLRSPDDLGIHEYRERQEAFVQSLRAVLEETGGNRGDKQLDHDALLMTSVELERTTNARREDQLWPGSTVITTDTRFSEAYRRTSLEPDVMPAAVTPSQWLVLMTASADPATTEQLAMAATTEIGRETMLSIATKFPVDVSQAVARVLSEDKSASVADIGTAQLTMEGILREQPDLVSEPEQASVQIASEVLRHRSRRLASSAAAQQDFANEARVRAEVEAALERQKAAAAAQALKDTRERLAAESSARTAAEARHDAERQRADSEVQRIEGHAERQLDEAQRDAKAQLEQANATHEQELADERRRGVRKAGVCVGVGVLIAAAVVCAVLGLWLAAIAMVVSIALLLYVGLEWAEHLEQGWHRLLFALVPQVLSLIQVFLK